MSSRQLLSGAVFLPCCRQKLPYRVQDDSITDLLLPISAYAAVESHSKGFPSDFAVLGEKMCLRLGLCDFGLAAASFWSILPHSCNYWPESL